MKKALIFIGILIFIVLGFMGMGLISYVKYDVYKSDCCYCEDNNDHCCTCTSVITKSHNGLSYLFTYVKSKINPNKYIQD